MSYNSAHDLPSFIELYNKLEGLKLLRFLLPKEQRSEVKKLETQIKEIGDTVDDFYKVLGDRHWIFHDMLNMDKVRTILTQNTGAEDAERQFIALYNDPEFLRFAIMRCSSFEALLKRKHLIEKARDDYFAGRYYACIYLLLSVADGFVNELEREHRGLHTRTSEELSAWDSPISLHKGIGNVHRTFLKQISVTITEPVEELYRNGIMHGTVLDFDNIIVATKAWNMLFAVMDWATAKTKAEEPKPPETSWKELFHQIIENDKNKKFSEAWSPYILCRGDAGFAEDLALIVCTEYLEAWKRKNFGTMSKRITDMDASRHGNAFLKVIRDNYELYGLEDFEVLALNHTTVALCEITVKIKLASTDERTVTILWRYEGDNGGFTMLPKGNGTWKLVQWSIPYFTGANEMLL